MKRIIQIITEDSVFYVAPENIGYVREVENETFIFLNDGTEIQTEQDINHLLELIYGEDYEIIPLTKEQDESPDDVQDYDVDNEEKESL